LSHAASSGRVYYAFDRHKQQGAMSYNASYPLWWSLDFNVNPLCSLIGQTVVAHEREYIRVLDELVLPDSNTRAACEEFFNSHGEVEKRQATRSPCLRRRHRRTS